MDKLQALTLPYMTWGAMVLIAIVIVIFFVGVIYEIVKTIIKWRRERALARQQNVSISATDQILYARNKNGEIVLVRGLQDGCSLEHVVLRDLDFTKRMLRGMIFRHCTIDNCIFNKAEMTNCQFEDCTISHCDFNHTRLTRVQIWDSSISYSFFLAVDFDHAHVDRTVVYATNFASANLTEAFFINCGFEKDGFGNVTFNKTRIQGSVVKCDFSFSKSLEGLILDDDTLQTLLSFFLSIVNNSSDGKIFQCFVKEGLLAPLTTIANLNLAQKQSAEATPEQK